MDDAELERLLTQLLRVVSPAPTGEPPVPARVVGSAADSVPAEAGIQAKDGHQPAAGETHAAGNGAGNRVGDGPAATPDAATAGPRGPAAALRGPAASPRGPTGEHPDLPAVSPSEARALIELVSARGIAQGELAGLLGLEKSTVSRLAAGLERKGWIRRGRDEGNQRYVRLYLTQEGRAVAAQVWTAWQSRQARILSALSPEERTGLSAGLRGLVRGLAAEGLLGEAQVPGQPRTDQPRTDQPRTDQPRTDQPRTGQT
jgi:DNA-binding MarR family transcriptional regulator